MRGDDAAAHSSVKLPPLYEPVILPRVPYVRPGLLIKQTQLTTGGKGGKNARLPFHGLFTMVDVPAYAFLGYYTGVFYDEDDESRAPSNYAVSGSGYVVVPPGEHHGGVDPAQYPMAMMNEPPRGRTANATMVEWATAKNAVPGVSPRSRVAVLAVHACVDIPAGSEIHFHYGKEYDRRHYGRKPYNVGSPCPGFAQTLVPDHERPRRALEMRGIHHVPEGTVFIFWG